MIMAIGKTPLFSELSGSCGPVDFRTRRNGKIEIGKKRIPANPQSIRQREVRAGYGRLYEVWQNASYIDKTQYKRLGKLYNVSAWNAFLMRHQSAMSAAPVASWGWVENSGLTLHDLEKNSLHGTIRGAIWNETDIANLSYLSFDGIDDDVEFPINPLLDITGSLTIESWISTTDLHGNILLHQYNTNNLAYDFGMFSECLFFRQGTATAASYATSFSKINTGDWVHVGISRIGNGTALNSISLIINGVPDRILQLPAVPFSSINNTYLSGNSGTGLLNGLIAVTNLYNYPKTAAQHLQFYNNTRHLFGV